MPMLINRRGFSQMTIGALASIHVAHAQSFGGSGLSDASDLLIRIPSYQITKLSAYNLSGAQLSLGKISKPGVVLNLWATWCVPCIEEMRSFSVLAKNLHGTGVNIIHVACESGTSANVARHAANMVGYQGPVYVSHPGRAVTDQLDVSIFPYTLLVRDQMVMGAAAGAGDWATPSAARSVKAILEL